MAEKRIKTFDKASREMLEKAKVDGVVTAWDRHEMMSPQCKFGASGLCCRNCFMGPCRVIEGVAGGDRGVCGATAGTIVARNFARMIAGGAAAHSDHGRDVANTLRAAAKGEAPGYTIKDEKKLNSIARLFEIETDGRSKQEIALELAEKALTEYGKPEGELVFTRYAPEATRKRWDSTGMMPRAVDREIVEIMHRTHIGVDQHYANILLHGSRAALSDGWGGSMIATELQDVLFGTPQPIRAVINLGVLKEDEVNVIVHGHEPVLSEMVVLASQDPELLELAKKNGAKGINLAGMCCTANELLMRHGIPVAGDFLQQELAIVTGAVDAMVVDVQCIMASVVDVSQCYHTKLITTSPKGRIPGATHIEFSEHRALEVAKEIVKTAILNFKNRPQNVLIPQEKTELIAGFSHETINYMLGGSFRASYRPLNDNIINGRISGVAGVVGCNNPKVRHGWVHVELVKELIANDILVVQTGCSALACAKAGLMVPEAARHAGKGLAEVCQTVGLPPVLHVGSCVDNSRILVALAHMVEEGGLGDDISDLPVAGAAPEWMSEKAISIGEYVIASGVFTVFGVGLPVMGSTEVSDLLFEKYQETRGATWAVASDPHAMATLMIDHINKKRQALGIEETKERKLFDMADRRELVV